MVERFLARREAFAGTVKDVVGGVSMLSFLIFCMLILPEIRP